MSRRDGSPDLAPSRYPFAMPRPKGKGPIVALLVLLVVAGFFLQLNWMQHVPKRQADEMVAPGGFADKLGRWMLMKKGMDPAAISGSPGVETIECGNCMGTGNVLSTESRKTICPICLGVGSRLIRRIDENDRICPLCAGMGRAESPDTGEVVTCPRCQGRGLIRSSAPHGAASGEN